MVDHDAPFSDETARKKRSFVKYLEQVRGAEAALRTARYEHSLMSLTSNLSLGDWEDALHGNAALTSTTLDHLLHHDHVIRTRGGSCRPRHARRSGLLRGKTNGARAGA